MPPDCVPSTYATRKALTIAQTGNRSVSTALDPQALALSALAWVLGDERRADRLLGLTGLSPDDLRGGLGDPAVQGAVLDFLMAHEADLVASAEALGVPPEALGQARAALTGGDPL